MWYRNQKDYSENPVTKIDLINLLHPHLPLYLVKRITKNALHHLWPLDHIINLITIRIHSMKTLHLIANLLIRAGMSTTRENGRHLMIGLVCDRVNLDLDKAEQRRVKSRSIHGVRVGSGI